MVKSILNFFKRKPDRIIGTGYLLRWYIVPRNRFLNIYLHCFLGSDDDRALHDHPWWSVSFLLKGLIVEVKRNETGAVHSESVKYVSRFVPVIRSPKHAHRIETFSDEAWTIFITGPKVREWGFWCPQGWRHWKEFTDETGNGVGRGCD